MRFDFSTAHRILFGRGVVQEAPSLAAGLGRHALVVTGSGAARAEPLLAGLHSRSVQTSVFQVAGEPAVGDVLAGMEQARQAGCDLVIGLGGGSVLDAGKAIAALLANGGDPLDYLEVVGRGQPLTQPSLPVIAIPTTAGTGS